MIARLFVLLPFHLTVPDGQQFPVHQAEDSGYGIHFYPPGRSENAPPLTDEEKITIDGVTAFQADALRIDFRKESFDRCAGTHIDPPEDVIDGAINFFLTRLRHVARAGQVRPVRFPLITWRMRYLNDDESELKEEAGLVRGRGTKSFSASFIALTNKIWTDVFNLPPDYEPPPWESLLLDATVEMPSIGPALVLAATALEVFISRVLDRLAPTKVIPPELWHWINERGGGPLRKEPSPVEQYDALLKLLTGHSLKDEPLLWEAFKNLKDARNAFVHEGIAKIGQTPVSTESANKLIASASDIIAKIREWLPNELHWPEFKYDLTVEIQKRLF
jgi:hypothetical protein